MCRPLEFTQSEMEPFDPLLNLSTHTKGTEEPLVAALLHYSALAQSLEKTSVWTPTRPNGALGSLKHPASSSGSLQLQITTSFFF